MLRFRLMKSSQKFASAHYSFYNHFNSQSHLVSRYVYRDMCSEALAEWRNLVA